MEETGDMKISTSLSG